MTIHPQHVADLEKLKAYYKAPMLMLGATGSVVPEFPEARDFFGQWVGDKYESLDLVGGDLEMDLNDDLKSLSRSYGCVFNLGTIEHTWNINMAYINALRAVKTGGYFLCHSPVSGYKSHGLHITNSLAIEAFVKKNGFEIVNSWITQARIGELLWLVAKKKRHTEAASKYKPAVQAYLEDGKKEIT